MVTLMGDFQAWPVSVPRGPYEGEGDETDTSGIGANCDVVWVLLVLLIDKTILEEALRHREDRKSVV